MKKLHFLLSTFLVFIFTSCGEDELKGVVLSEDPWYVKEPLVAIQAEDGTGNWINGLIDQNSRVIALDFRILDDQSAVNVKLKLADEWAKPIDPLTTDAVLDLSSGITRIKVNDGADDIRAAFRPVAARSRSVRRWFAANPVPHAPPMWPAPHRSCPQAAALP